jgi:hypothetical protein
MSKFRDVAPTARGYYWCNFGTKCVIATLLNEEIELFQLLSNQNLGGDWTPLTSRPGWYFKEEFGENLNFFPFP